MENKEAKRLGVLGTASKCAGAGLGTVAKVTTGVKNLLTRPIDDIEHDVDEDEQVEATTQNPALKPEIENTGSKEPELTGKAASLEAELNEARNLLADMKSNAEKMQSYFELQLATLQAEKDSLLFDMEQTAKEVNDLKSTEAALRARIAALESEPEIVKPKTEKPVSPLIQARPLLSEVGTARIERDTDISEKITVPKNDVKVEEVIEEPQPEPKSVESDISVPQETESIETKQADLPEQVEKESEIVQTEQGVEPLVEAIAVQSDESEQVEIENRESGQVAIETSSSVPADVTVEEVNAADFDSVSEKIIFLNALSGIASSDKTTRLNAVKVMAGIHHELSARALVVQMAKEPVPQIRAECINALAEVNMKEGLLAIENALSEQDVSVRLAAVRGLYRLGGLASAPQLLRMLCDENEDVRRRTVSCIGWLGKEELAVELVPLLDDNSVSVRLAAIEATGNLRNHQVVSDLIIHLEDSEKEVRKTIIAALKTITGKKMSGSFPRDEKSLKILIIRWTEWWKDEHKVLCRI